MSIEYSDGWWAILYNVLRHSYAFIDVIDPKDWVAIVYFDLKTEILTD